MEHEEVTGPSAEEDQGDGQDKEDSLITPRVGLIIGVSAVAGVWVGRSAGAEAGSAAGLAVATMLDRVLQRGRQDRAVLPTPRSQLGERRARPGCRFSPHSLCAVVFMTSIT